KIKVTRGLEKEVNLVAKESLTVVTPKGKNNNVQKKVVLSSGNLLRAPINQAEKYGELIAYLDGKEVGKVDLITDKSIGKATFKSRFQELFSAFYSINN